MRGRGRCAKTRRKSVGKPASETLATKMLAVRAKCRADWGEISNIGNRVQYSVPVLNGTKGYTQHFRSQGCRLVVIGIAEWLDFRFAYFWLFEC